MRVLCVAEKPSIAKSISQILSGGHFEMRHSPNKYCKNYDFMYPQTNSYYTVTSVLGHLMTHDFDDNHNTWSSCDPFSLFDASIVAFVMPDLQTVATNLKAEARRAQTLMIWTDCDREGENIGSEIVDVCRKANQNITVKRARFNAIIAQQIHHAAQHPVELDMAQSRAVEARMELDLRLGAAFTRMQSLALQARFPNEFKIPKGVVSYGPCQFPTLGFVVARYNMVKLFKPEPFWYIFLSIRQPGPSKGLAEETQFLWRRGHLFDKEVATALHEHVLANPEAKVIKVTEKMTKKWKPLPLTTVELQKAGSRLLRMTPKKVLDLAEKLYQEGFLSYPRTETDQFDAQFDFMTLIEKQSVDPAWGAFAASLQQGGFSVPRRGKNNDKAHPPIHPTAHTTNLPGDAKRVFEFVTRRFLACCSKDGLGSETTVDIQCGDEFFYATGLIVLERNYLDVYPYDKWNTKEIPAFRQGQQFMPSVCELRDGETTSPSYLTEADLVTLMDKNGIGTDATIAQHIQTIIDRNYVKEQMQGPTKYLTPSPLGIGLIEGYNEIGFDKSLSKPQLRRETERAMVQICEGTKSKNDMLLQSIEQYKEIYVKARVEFNKIMVSVGNHLNGDPGADAYIVGGAGGGGDNGGDGPARGGGGGGGNGRGSRGPRGARGARGGARGSRGKGRGRGRSKGKGKSTDARGGPSSRGSRGRSTGRSAGTTPRDNISDDDSFEFDDSPPPPPPPPRRVPVPPRPRLMRSRANSSVDTRLSENGPTATPRCKCGLPAVQKANTGASFGAGRPYWACEMGACSFFVFEDYNPETPIVQDPLPKVIPAKRPFNGRIDQSYIGYGSFEWEDGTSGSKASNAPVTGSTNIARPASRSSGPQVDDECFNCKKRGHWASDCPDGGGKTFKRPKSFVVPTETYPVICYKCGEPGHYSNACPIGKRGSGSGLPAQRAPVSSAGKGVCFKCNQEGHWSKECPSSINNRSPWESRYGKAASALGNEDDKN